MVSQSQYKQSPPFLLKIKLIWLAVLFSNCFLYDFSATRSQIFFLIFSYYSFLLKSYHIIVTLIAAIGLEKSPMAHR